MSAHPITLDDQTDLIDIRLYTIQKWGKRQSQRYLSKRRQSILLLTETPYLGKLRCDVGTGVLSFPHASHVIYYVEYDNQIVVFAVLHQKMLPSTHLTESKH